MEAQAYIQGRKLAPQQLGRVLVLGLGKSGKSAARYLAALAGTRVERLFVAAGARTDDSEAFLRTIEGPGVEWAFGDEALSGFEADGGTCFDLCIASPGIPFWHDLYVAGERLSRELVSEVEFAWRESAADSTWVAITGTNGKTTTTSLAAHVLASCGLAARAVGNIGDVCLDAVEAGDCDVYVAEVSSYQLYSTRFFAPDVAVMLNITPDHVHWHRTFEAYRDAKFTLIDHMLAPRPAGLAASDREPVIILDAVNDVVRAKVRELKSLSSVKSLSSEETVSASGSISSEETASAPKSSSSGEIDLLRGNRFPPGKSISSEETVSGSEPFSSEEVGFAYVPMGTADGIHGDMRAKCGAANAAFLDAGNVLRVALGGVEHDLGSADALLIKGAHNASNALAAAAVAVALEADDAAIREALATFQPLEHRIEPCGLVRGIECYNDSKATNVDATLKALEAFPGRRVVVLLGGDDKGTALDELVASANEHAAAAVCFGAAGPRFAQAFEAAAPQPCTRAEDANGDPSTSGSAAGQAEPFSLLKAGGLEDALDTALAAAAPGDVVLLSPACASFDEFHSFEERGEVFKELVKERAERERA